MLGDSRYFYSKQFRNLTLSKIDCISFDSYIYTGVTLWCLIYYELRIDCFHIHMVILFNIQSNIRQEVDGFAFERIDGAGVFFGVLEAGMTDEQGNSFDVGSVVELVDCK